MNGLEKQLAADPTYAPVYLDYFNYYTERDVNVAKEYLDKFVANADQDCDTDYFVARLFIPRRKIPGIYR